MKKIIEKIRNSPICYFSDLFVVAMVIGWLFTGVIMMGAAIYSMVVLADTSIWSNVAELVTLPLSAGGALWMLKNSVQHAILNKQGKAVEQDFPAVHPDDENMENEKLMSEEIEDNNEDSDEDSEEESENLNTEELI